MATIKRMIENPSEVLDNNQSGLISTIEISKLSEMKQEEVNISAAQMLVLANSIVSGKEDMDSRIASLEKQAWYKRMWNSLNGKMKGTKEEFEQNKEKIALYAVQAVSALYEADKFNQDMLLVIKQKITDICYFTTVNGVEHILKKEFAGEIRNTAKELTVKINEATAQLDVLTIINADCGSGKYDYGNPIAAICDVISKLDGNLLSDGSAVDSVRENLCNGRILDEYEKPLYKFMDDVINIPAEMTGEIYIELASMLDNLWAEMFAELMESYNMLPKMERMAKKKDAIIKAILEKNDIEETTEFTAVDLLEALLAARIEMADMTGNVNFEQIEKSAQATENYSDTANDEDEIACENEIYDYEYEITSSISSKTIEESSQKEKKYDIYNEPQYDEKDMKFCPHIKLKKGGQYVKCYIPLHDFAVESGKIKKTIYSSKGRSLLKIIFDIMGYISDDEIIISKSGMNVTGINSKISRSGFLLYDIGDNLDYYDISPWRYSYFRVELAIPKAIYDRIIVPKSEVKVCFPDSETVIRRRLEFFMPLTANSMDDKMKLNGLSANELYDNRKLIKASTHLLSFADIEELVHHRGVLIGGMINGSANPDVDTEIYGAYPRMVTPDGNVIMCNTNVDPFIIKGQK